jgi:hypothetical protein
VRNSSNSSPLLTNVTVNVSGGTNANNGIANFSSSIRIQQSNISAPSGTASVAVYNDATSGSYTVTIDNSTLTSVHNTIVNDTEFTTRVGASKLAGGAVAPGGTLTCANVHDENYVAFTSTCP